MFLKKSETQNQLMNTPKQNKDALGKGIRSLLQSIDADLKVIEFKRVALG